MVSRWRPQLAERLPVESLRSNQQRQQICMGCLRILYLDNSIIPEEDWCLHCVQSPNTISIRNLFHVCLKLLLLPLNYDDQTYPPLPACSSNLEALHFMYKFYNESRETRTTTLMPETKNHEVKLTDQTNNIKLISSIKQSEETKYATRKTKKISFKEILFQSKAERLSPPSLPQNFREKRFQASSSVVTARDKNNKEPKRKPQLAKISKIQTFLQKPIPQPEYQNPDGPQTYLHPNFSREQASKNRKRAAKTTQKQHKPVKNTKTSAANEQRH